MRHTNETNGRGSRIIAACLMALAAGACAARPAAAQSDGPAIFVSNNGNLEGSVTAFRVNVDGTLDFANKVVTGTRATTSDPCPGCNAYDISITPDGRHLATCHPAGDVDGITIYRINSDATVTQTLQHVLGILEGGPLDLVWLNNEYLAVARLDTNPDQIVIYRHNTVGPSLTFVTAVPTTSNSLGYFAVHPSGQYLYANDSSGLRLIRAYSIAPNGSLTSIDNESTGTPFALELAVSRDGTKLYGACGISDGGNKVLGFDIAPDGTLTQIVGSPFLSQGASPSNVYCDDAGRYVVVGHGTDATMRSMSVDSVTGALTATGFMFDVGGQGTLGDVHSRGGFAFVTDNSTSTDGLMGIYSFTLKPDGSFELNGPGIYSTQGIAPRSIVSWFPAPLCPTDVNGSGNVDIDDLLLVINNWGGGQGNPADVDGDGDVDIDDLLLVINNWGPCQ
jgi:6-phosphogluconolactonase (cycloisomerase 2 family)